jgi:hypothetical protein
MAHLYSAAVRIMRETEFVMETTKIIANFPSRITAKSKLVGYIRKHFY